MSKFTWRIENFSKLDAKKLFSVAFIVNDYQWRLSLYPKGNNADRHLSLYLGVVRSSALPDDWSIKAKFSLALINQIDRNKTIKKDTEHTFNSQESYWGFTKYTRLDQFHDKTGGFLVGDTCLIEAELFVTDASSPKKDLDSSADSMYIQAQSLLDSLPKIQSASETNVTTTLEMPMFKGHATYAKEILDKLISSSLDDLADPKHESAMMQSLSTLADNLSLFSDVQAKAVKDLKATYPQIMQEWRDSRQVKKGSDHLWTTFEKTKSLLEGLVKTYEAIETKLKDLDDKKKEVKTELEGVKSRIQQLKEERVEVSEQTKVVCSLAKDLFSKVEEEEVEVDCAKRKLEQSLKEKWASIRQLFA
ncbi:unnamed protein product [Cuscuta campestris]|uniref:MATH domain-containing protein n=1 Tax=Cuscuta campestris TaxID=132261 RepID=A0A484L3W1_9ASTE|nr:unnamed protein product [Cuscuta campestris]